MEIKQAEQIFRYFKLLKEMHGSKDRNLLIQETALNFGTTETDVEMALSFFSIPTYNFKSKEYGLIIGRFQPFHYGHQHIINEVLLDKKIPIIVMGNDYGKRPDKNPLSIQQRQELIKLIYPNVEILFEWVGDNPDWNIWWNDMGLAVIGSSGRQKNQVTLYYNNKESDRYNQFEVLGKEYINEFYTKVFEDNGIKTKQISFVERTDIKVDAHATNIRDDFEQFKHLIDARVYWKLKEWGW